ncbi:hypothetical protein L6164_020563 [Bauhinia variegata]|uniref:Uncharacterized protein n=1 Tax=Bauhinia variegata TaxID=167791 RepID=A0ACB9MYX2_BAUVA|nr:hypothetical protein L6164_020563 [Bauhinia variegata]
MAGTPAVAQSNCMENSLVMASTSGDQWEIHFARFFPYPLITTSSFSSDLVPLGRSFKNSRPKGNWISSSSPSFLRLAHHHSNSDVILTVSFNGEVLEEHYVSKLHFSWPQVSCVPGFPARGTRTILVSYRDSIGEVQKFALRFPSICATQSFIYALKEILKVEKGPDPEPLNTDFGSQISSQSGFMSSNKHYHRPCEELSNTSPFDVYTPQMPPSSKSEGERHLGTQVKETTLSQKIERVLPVLPPSFTSLLMDCSEINHESCVAIQPIDSKKIDLESQIAKYMEDSSFQDMLEKVEKVLSEIGCDMSL